MVGKVSHELRTPLNAIILLIDCAIQQSKDYNMPDEFIKKFLDPTLMNSKYLYSLINDILDYTEINLNGNLKLVYEKTQIKNLVEEVKLVL